MKDILDELYQRFYHTSPRTNLQRDIEEASALIHLHFRQHFLTRNLALHIIPPGLTGSGRPFLEL